MNRINKIAVIDRYVLYKVGLKRARKIGTFLLGAVPTIGTFWIVVHLVYILLTGTECHLTDFLFGYGLLWFILATVLSIAYNFCWIHRAFILYDYIAGIVDTEYVSVKLAILIVGVILVVVFIRNQQWRSFEAHTRTR